MPLWCTVAMFFHVPRGLRVVLLESFVFVRWHLRTAAWPMKRKRQVMGTSYTTLSFTPNRFFLLFDVALSEVVASWNWRQPRQFENIAENYGHPKFPDSSLRRNCFCFQLYTSQLPPFWPFHALHPICPILSSRLCFVVRCLLLRKARIDTSPWC